MVQASSSSKSSRSHSKSLPKKPDAVSMAKAKKTKQESIKKYVRKGKHFILLSNCASDVEFDQMKTQNLSKKIRRQKP
jgi:hypothetical protein